MVTLFLLFISANLFAATIAQRVGIASSPNPVGSGARAVGMGGAFIAVADDATAASWNPAGLIQLEKPELSVVGAYDSRSENFFSVSHPESNTDSRMNESSINYLSASMPFYFLNKNMVASINYQRLFNFNRSINYRIKETVPPPVNLVTVEDRTYDQEGFLSAVGLAWAIELTPRISIGVSLNIWSSNLGWENGWEGKYTNHIVGTRGLTTNIEDSLITEKYNDLKGFNANLGVLWNANQHLTVGAVLKTPFTAEFDHQYQDVWVQRNGAGAITGSTNVSISEDVELEMPMSYGIGAAWRFSDQFTMDLDIYKTLWDDYILTDGQGNKMSPINGRPENLSDIKNTVQVRMGAEYLFFKMDNNLIIPLRGGLFYDPEPAQGKVKDFYGASIGSGIGYKRYIFDVAYQARWGKDVDTGNIIGASSADIMQHTFLVSFIMHF